MIPAELRIFWSTLAVQGEEDLASHAGRVTLAVARLAACFFVHSLFFAAAIGGHGYCQEWAIAPLKKHLIESSLGASLSLLLLLALAVHQMAVGALIAQGGGGVNDS